MIAETRVSWPGWAVFGAVFVGVLLLQSPLIFNPGYFSHDELQWASFASQSPGWYFREHLWTGLQSFQYRPLTFSLWLWLSEHLFARPWAFHGVMVALGGLNAGLLALLMRGFGHSTALSVSAGLLFALSPYAAYTHAWVGTLGDLLWVGCALSICLIVRGDRSPIASAIAVFVLTSVALLAKESGVVIPALLGLAWLFFERKRNWGTAMLVSLIPVAAYLAVRVGVLLFSPREAANYGWDLAFIPQRWLEYQLFPFNPGKTEVHNTLARSFTDPRTLANLALWLALLAVLWRAGKAWFCAFLLCGSAALGPVLILALSANQYAYGFAAVTSAICVGAWPRIGRAGRAVLALLVLLCVWHSTNIMRRMHQAGEMQAVFSPALAKLVRTNGDNTIRLRSADPSQRWLFDRLTHDIPSYRGVPIGKRVVLVREGEAADYAIEPDGRLTPLR